MNRTGTVVAISFAYLSLAALANYVWLVWLSPVLPDYVPVVCALPPVLLWLVTRAKQLSSRERVLRSVAAFMFLPILLLMWSAETDFEPAPSEASQAPADTLRADELFAGASARQELPASSGAGFSSAGATFADGSELRLSRFAGVSEAENYLRLLSQSVHTRDTTLGPRKGKSALLAANVLVYWELHGATLLELRAESERLVQARLDAQHVPLPSQPSARVPHSEPKARWPCVLSYVTLHLIAFLTLVFWVAAATTRVLAEKGVQTLPESALLARIAALSELGARCSVAAGETEHERVIALMTNESSGRAHRLTVRVDATGKVVHIFEVESGQAATPRSANEADMRTVGETAYDPSRPRAQKVWSRKRQTTFIEPERLAGLPLSFAGRSPELPPGFAATLDADGIIHLLCALVTNAGYDYQPVLFGFEGGPSTKP